MCIDVQKQWWAQMVKIIVMAAAAHNVAKLFLGLD